MSENTISEIMALKEMSLGELEKKYKAVFDGKKAPSNNKERIYCAAYCRKSVEERSDETFGSIENQVAALRFKGYNNIS
ncbi:MAG: hypothetical protein KKB22_01580 [Candidatus Omnitrophica bacterium]|nr:hypothetical protein [Candidatus Omnitrophota bacterium]